MAAAADPSFQFDPQFLNHHRSPDSLRFLRGLCCRDPDVRSHTLKCVRKTMDGWVEGYGSPPNHILQRGGASCFTAVDRNRLVREQLPDILRLSIDCPFPDLREKCSDYLLDLQDRGVRIPRLNVFSASSFIPSSEMISIDEETEETRALLVEAFLQSDRLDHHLQVMAFHPIYLVCFLKTQYFLMRGDGPLPYHYRHYIAIMAAARQQCTYLVNTHMSEFLIQGGDESWLRGLEHVCPKLRGLSEVNKLLAHRPWLITKDHISSLVSGPDKWSMSELMQALVLLAHFHSLASFVYGCGVNAEIDHPGGHVFMSSSPRTFIGGGDQVLTTNHGVGASSMNGHPVQHTDKVAPSLADMTSDTSIDLVMVKMKNLSQESSSGTNEAEMRESFEMVETQNTDLQGSLDGEAWPKEDTSRFVDDADFTYQYVGSTSVGGSSSCGRVQTFCTGDFSWEHHGYSLSCHLYMDVGVLLDDEFRMAKSMTYNSMGNNRNVDTTSFRHAIWNYVHCLYGIRHEEYDYGAVNQLLNSKLKAFVKAVACQPERVTRHDYDSFMRDLRHSEKVHVSLILLEARMQAELMYSLRAVSSYLCTT